MPQPKKPATPSSPLSANSILTASGLGGGQVLTFNLGPPEATDIEEMVRTADIEWNLNFGYVRFSKGLKEGFDMIEVGNWIEELLDVELVQFVFGVPGSDISAIVRRKEKI
jgi:hypothetical protein